ncbi:DNA-directed RNA polymerase subunit B, partial [Candidatus Woesearchaeota archaeon]|nr:DNA-directed RNA polymerase subunit B [Candidatus Woesearchaeota archaeon]
MTDIYLNEKFIGNVENPEEFMNKIKEERRKGKVTGILNMHYDKKMDEIYLDTSKGRPRRPLIIVENGKSRLTDDRIKKLEKNEMKWQDLINEGIVEYVDAAEEDNLLVALNEDEITKNHTHLEISPLVILGPVTSLIPYANFGQSARLNRGSKAPKQALGLYASNFFARMDTDVSVLHYPQRPIVRSFMADVINLDKHPAGQNVTIALMSYKGYNMSDAIILNKASIDRGLGRSTFFRPYSAEELRYSGGFVDEICVPTKDVKGYKSEKDYKHLEDDGIVYPEAILREEDVVIGK